MSAAQPGETDETIGETIDFIHRHADAIDIVESVNPICLMPLSTHFTRKAELGIGSGQIYRWRRQLEQEDIE